MGNFAENVNLGKRFFMLYSNVVWKFQLWEFMNKYGNFELLCAAHDTSMGGLKLLHFGGGVYFHMYHGICEHAIPMGQFFHKKYIYMYIYIDMRPTFTEESIK